MNIKTPSSSHVLPDPSTDLPTSVQDSQTTFTVLQLTDLHLFLDANQIGSGISNQQSFEHCLTQALNEKKCCDLILLTGDLVHEVNTEIYDRIFERLEKTGIPFACIAGNHDVTDEINTALDYSQREYLAHNPDPRLLSRHVIKANGWHILLIDSSIPGKVYGTVGKENLQWLKQTLNIIHTPVIIVMHHHVLPMTSAWINRHITKDADEFWQVIAQYSNVKAIVTGHVHQQFETEYKDVTVLATPSTCYQFKPDCDDFTLDKDAQPGYRWLALGKDGEFNSWIERLSSPI